MLNFLLERCATDHPHHTLPLLFSLKNSEKDKCFGEASETSAAGGAGEAVDEAGASGAGGASGAAASLLHELARRRPLARGVAQTEGLCDGTVPPS